MEVNKKTALVFGLGKSGVGAANLLKKHGADVICYDSNSKGIISEDKVRDDLDNPDDVKIILGDLPKEVLDTLDIVVLSPGIPKDLDIVKKMYEKGVCVIGEVELAFELGRGDVLAITGTNGKTTTTSLLGEIMKLYSDDVFVVGNIGNPYTCVADETDDKSVVVAEVSSFQLDTIDKFKPKVSSILNITPDHMDRHHTMDNYIQAKEDINKNQDDSDYVVLNYEDEVLRSFGDTANGKVLYFSSSHEVANGVYYDHGNLILSDGEDKLRICNVDELQLLGMHNYENYMAAIAMAHAYGVPSEIIRMGCLEFKGVEHRIEFVVEKKGIAYYNDSKATNPDAAIKGIEAMVRPTVLIGGGYDKGSTYKEWIEAFSGKVKKLILLGETKEKIAKDADEAGFKNYIFVDTLEDAVKSANEIATSGDAVLLSPACASWDMFPNYEVRGDKFKELVKRL
ncbi:MAG: UDP-N-acetylmuramoyl-L-alanine--D-glutamate ligase [Lachnospiraceae bacterium]|nr:UDP-N-acetylmuramoyl-L-alanine--D-glutamate ligase [Lachnospiraceae bacterium]